MPVKHNEREYRCIHAGALELRTGDNDGKFVEGYATTFNEEYELYGWEGYKVVESIDARAFDDTDMSDVIMQYDHEGRVFARTSNGTLTLSADDHGLRIRADLGGTELGRQLYEEIRGGYTDKMSFGFVVAKDEITEERDEENNMTTIHRKITKIKKLYDVSAVSLPANGTTEIYSARSFAEGVIEKARMEYAAIEERKRKIKKIKILMEANTYEND